MSSALGNMLEAECLRCGETVNPHSEDPEDLVHGEKLDGTECGGILRVTGEWIRN